MRGRVIRAGAAIAMATILSAIVAAAAFAATPKATTWEVVAGNFGRATSANAYQAKLAKAGLAGFAIERESHGKGHYQVEASFATKAAATAEVARLKAAHYRGGIEADAAGAR